MILRICDNGNEQIEPASPDRVAQVLAPNARIADGTEITVAEGERWLTAMAVGAAGTPTELLMSGADGEHATVSGIAARSEALQLFREFMASTGSLWT
jgi:hypothetical protein